MPTGCNFHGTASIRRTDLPLAACPAAAAHRTIPANSTSRSSTHPGNRRTIRRRNRQRIVPHPRRPRPRALRRAGSPDGIAPSSRPRSLHTGATGTAVVPPLVVTQDYLVSPERLTEPGRPVLGRPATLLLWSSLLLEIDLDHYTRLFPVAPVNRDLRWATKTAREILGVRNLLVESGHTLASAAERLAERDMEPGRWRDLARLEEAAVTRTPALDREDEAIARFLAAEEGTLPPGITHVSVIAVPDLRELATRALARFAASVPVEILVAAPEDRANHFDRWGRPLAASWLEAEIPLPNPENTIHRVATPSDQAALACSLMDGTEKPATQFAVGVLDPETIAPVEQAAAARNWSTYDPAGKPLSRQGIAFVLEQTARLLATNSFEAAARLLRCPDFGRAVTGRIPADEETGQRPSLSRLLGDVDDFALQCLPDRLDEAIALARRFDRTRRGRTHAEAALRAIRDLVRPLRSGAFSPHLVEYLSEVFSGRTFRPTDASHGAFTEIAAALDDSETAFVEAGALVGTTASPEDRFLLLLDLLRDRRLYGERSANAIDLQGWLELLWEDAPCLVLLGMNDEFVPESILGHAFLPDSARRVLGVVNNDERFARDAYLLTALLSARTGEGCRVDLVFGRQSAGGDPLRPSRLLFQCPDEDLPSRTLRFFTGETPALAPEPRTLPWRLKPGPLPAEARILERLTVTQFRSYLACPFRFYLTHGLGMEEIEIDKTEMDARDFGNLLHDAVERLGRDETMCHSTDAGEITGFFHEAIDEFLSQRFGNELATPLLVQREAARKRLAWWAEIEAERRDSGWHIVAVEAALSEDAETPFTISGHPVTGRIDRIERHEDGSLQVFDFKTHSVFDTSRKSNRAVADYHLVPVKRTEDPARFPEWALVETGEGGPRHWVDLQIPLYVHALRRRFPDAEIGAGHIPLGRTKGEVFVDVWTDLGDELLASAWLCAEGVVASIREHRFWPPGDSPAWQSPIEEILFDEPGDTVDPTLLSSGANPV